MFITNDLHEHDMCVCMNLNHGMNRVLHMKACPYLCTIQVHDMNVYGMGILRVQYIRTYCTHQQDIHITDNVYQFSIEYIE